MIELSVNKFGEGCPLIILHGLYGSGSNWMSIGRALSKYFTIYLVDQRNHGNSPHHPDFNYQVMTHDLKSFLDSNNLDKVCILGHSMGGKVAMNFALQHPDRVQKLVVIDIALRSYIQTTNGNQSIQNIVHEKIINSLAKLDIDFAETREELDKQLAQNLPQKAIRSFLLKNLKRSKNGDFYWGLNIPSIQENLGFILAEIENSDKTFNPPVLIISGKKSGYINEQDIVDFKRVFTNVAFSELDTGHWVHSEQPLKLIELLTKFLPLD